MRRSRLGLAAVLVLAVLPGVGPAAADGEGLTQRVSVSSDGTQSDGASWYPAISADGRYVAFDSDAANLVPGDTNGHTDVFVRDLRTGQTTRVSVASDGAQADSASNDPAISRNGRYVAFASSATTLVAQPTFGFSQVYVHDRVTAQTTMVSVDSSGATGNHHSGYPALSADGRYVAFDSRATNLVTDDTNSKGDVFVHDRQTGQTTRVSLPDPGTGMTEADGDSREPSISGNGRYVVFISGATNLVVGDTNDKRDVFVHDRQTGQTTRVSLPDPGTGMTEADEHSDEASIDDSGTWVAFRSAASNLVAEPGGGWQHVYLRHLPTNATTRVSVSSSGEPGNSHSDSFSAGVVVSDQARHVVFYSSATNLVPDDTNMSSDVFVHERETGQTSRVNLASDGAQATGGDGYAPAINADGRYVAFQEAATNLVPGDTNMLLDLFVRTRSLPTVTAVAPDTLEQGATGAVVTVTGSGFTDQPTVGFGPGVTVETLAFTSAGELEATVSVAAGAAAGARTVTVTNPAGDAADCADCFTVTEASDEPEPPDGACPPGEVPPSGFADIAGNTHEAAIECVAFHGIAQGVTADTYGPAQPVTRAQMASFIARMMEAAGQVFPPASDQGFTDIAGSVHAERINQLAEAGVVQGVTPTSYAPSLPVRRDQMASFLVRAYEHVAGPLPPPPPSGFTDTAGNTHEANIDKAAAAGFALGTTPTTYQPAASVRRDQMASFITRVLDRLAAGGHLS